MSTSGLPCSLAGCDCVGLRRAGAWPACGSGAGVACPAGGWSGVRAPWPACGSASASLERRRCGARRRPDAPRAPYRPSSSTGRGSTAGTGVRSPGRTASVPRAIARSIHGLRDDREGVLAGGLDDHVEVSATAMRNSSTVTGCTGMPSAATTVIFSPGMRTSKYDIADPLMKRRRTRSPGLNRPSSCPRASCRSSGTCRWSRTRPRDRRVHPHLAPRHALGHRRAPSPVARRERNRRASAGASCSSPTASSACEHARGILVGPVGEHHHVLAVVANGSGSRGSMTIGP